MGEINLDRAEWNIAADRMKTGEPHLVPLSQQAVKVLRELLPVTGGGRYVFATGDRPMSKNTVNAGLRRIGDPRAGGGAANLFRSRGRGL